MDIHLITSPIPSGDTQDDIQRDPRICYTCWNLYGGSAMTACFSPAICMHTYSGPRNAARAAKLKDIGPSPRWAGDYRTDYTAWEFTVRLVEVPDSAAAGCYTCQLLHIAVQKLSRGSVDYNDRSLRLNVTICLDNIMRLELASYHDDVEADYLGLDVSEDALPDANLPWYRDQHRWELYTLPGAPCPWPTIGNFMNKEFPRSDARHWDGGCARHVSSDATSPALFHRIKSWIKSCEQNHIACAQVGLAGTKSLPKRVLRIDPTSDDDIRLVERGDAHHHEAQPYIALSHCWGATQHLMTTTATLSERKRKLSLQSMSRTFQDAIIIARRLGIYYLWIDSLCIIQDDTKDWQTEAAKMAEVYNGAYLVVAASASSDGSRGCFFGREPYITINGTSSTGESFQIYGREPKPHDVFGWGATGTMRTVDALVSNLEELKSFAAVYPLMSRAWCFQERMLATRILHYTEKEVVFECVSSLNCECGALEDFDQDAHMEARRVILTGSVQVPNGIAHGRKQRPPDINDLWRDLMTIFSQKQITKRTDYLLAIAGLASKWHNNVSSERYLAGVWKSDLLRGMTWVPQECDNGTEIKTILPSWSWLSLHRGVTWGNNSRGDRVWEYFVDIDHDETMCHPVYDASPFGHIDSGYISLTGKIMPVKICPNQGQFIHLQKDGHDELATFEKPDSLYRIQQHRNEQIYCLRFCSFATGSVMGHDEDTALVLARPTPDELHRQPKHVREFDQVYVRLRITNRYPTADWKHLTDSSEVQLYLI